MAIKPKTATAKPAAPTRKKSTVKAAKPAKTIKPARTAKSKGATLAADAAVNGNGASPGGRRLVVVESPAKAATISRFLGRGYTVKASMGHVRDLPQGKLGVDIEHEFEPQYAVMAEKKKVIADLKEAGEKADAIYLATDPDREGEAISWHLNTAAGWDRGHKPVKRVVFHEITPDAVREAFANERAIDMRLVNAQQARRILDRLVGYQLSPLLWRKVQRGLSAGRVQSVALRLVVERDRSIDAFKPVEYWSLEATLKPETGNSFVAALHSVTADKKKVELPDSPTVERILADIENARYAVSGVTMREVRRRPAPPFITSTLQQEASRQLRFSARKTMSVAQQLYEGMAIGAEGSVGLITYMRTDSPVLSETAMREAEAYIRERFGKDYTSGWRRYTSKSKVAQEAHEAIRPTSVRRAPESIRQYLSPDHYRLYDLIWKRMLASQMADAILDSTQVEVQTTGKSGTVYTFRATGAVIKFAGFRTLYIEAKDDGETAGDDEDDRERVLPRLT
ncbi:MAG: type I DNA topoisomerase, partial [SAR202 cluster bacterium]|nr:type I DNA topoisomerase [SAR202 cluster bacterium]